MMNEFGMLTLFRCRVTRPGAIVKKRACLKSSFLINYRG